MFQIVELRITPQKTYGRTIGTNFESFEDAVRETNRMIELKIRSSIKHKRIPYGVIVSNYGKTTKITYTISRA